MAIFVRLGKAQLGPPTYGHEARCIVAPVAAANGDRIVVASVYLVTGVKMEGPNVEILAGASRLVAAYAGPFVVCGDMQNGPEELYDAGIPQLLGGQLLPPRCGHGTCQGRKKRSTIDMFVASSDIAGCMTSVKVDVSMPSNPHWSVALEVAAE